MSGNPKQDQFQVKGAPKSTEHDQNLISSEGGRDTSEYQNSGHSSHFSKEKIWKPQMRDRPWPKSNHIWRWSRYISMPKFGPLHICVLMKMPGNLKLISFTNSKWHQNEENLQTVTTIYSNQFSRWSGYISIQNLIPFLPCVLTEMPWNPNLTHFTKSKWLQKEESQQTVTVM